MKPLILIVAGVAVLTLAGCNDRSRASNDVKWNDRPADITCGTYGVQSFEGRSTGRVGYDEGGRISFVDAANGRYTTVEGDCRVVYQMGEGTDAPAETPAPAPLPTPPAGEVPAAEPAA